MRKVIKTTTQTNNKKATTIPITKPVIDFHLIYISMNMTLEHLSKSLDTMLT